MNFKEFLISKNIAFEEDPTDNSLILNDEDLIPYEAEVKELFPGFTFMWEMDMEDLDTDETFEIE